MLLALRQGGTHRQVAVDSHVRNLEGLLVGHRLVVLSALFVGFVRVQVAVHGKWTIISIVLGRKGCHARWGSPRLEGKWCCFVGVVLLVWFGSVLF